MCVKTLLYFINKHVIVCKLFSLQNHIDSRYVMFSHVSLWYSTPAQEVSIRNLFKILSFVRSKLIIWKRSLLNLIWWTKTDYNFIFQIILNNLLGRSFKYNISIWNKLVLTITVTKASWGPLTDFWNLLKSKLYPLVSGFNMDKLWQILLKVIGVAFKS